MIENLLYFIGAAIGAFIIWYVVGLFIKNGVIISLIGIFLGLCLLVYGLRFFKIPIFLLALCLSLGSCSTTVSEDGREVFRTYANTSYIKLRTAKGTRLEMRGVDHAAPTRAAFIGGRDLTLAAAMALMGVK